MKSFFKTLYKAFFGYTFILLMFKRIFGTPKFYRYLTVKGFFKRKVKNNDVWFYSNHTAYIEKEVFWNGFFNEFEPFTLKLWLELVKNSKVIFDIGSNTGIFSLSAAAVNSNCKIYAFEPVNYNYEILLKASQRNRFNNIFLEPHAVSDSFGKKEITVEKGVVNYMNSLSLDRLKDNIESIDIETIRLDEFIESNSISNVDLIKIDIEGHEINALEGMGGFIDNYEPKIIIEIIDELESRKIIDFAKTHKYSLEKINELKQKVEPINTLSFTERSNYLLTPIE